VDIKEFISETLSQIVDGVVEAQQRTKEKRAVVVPHHEYFKRVGFDVAVTVVESMEKTGKAGITVWSVGGGVSGKSEKSSSTVSRIQFEIPIELPKGSETPSSPDQMIPNSPFA